MTTKNITAAQLIAALSKEPPDAIVVMVNDDSEPVAVHSVSGNEPYDANEEDWGKHWGVEDSTKCVTLWSNPPQAVEGYKVVDRSKITVRPFEVK